jgi:hypothetical protein
MTEQEDNGAGQQVIKALKSLRAIIEEMPNTPRKHQAALALYSTQTKIYKAWPQNWVRPSGTLDDEY